jgi:hypothetical protein
VVEWDMGNACFFAVVELGVVVDFVRLMPLEKVPRDMPIYDRQLCRRCQVYSVEMQTLELRKCSSEVVTVKVNIVQSLSRCTKAIAIHTPYAQWSLFTSGFGVHCSLSKDCFGSWCSCCHFPFNRGIKISGSAMGCGVVVFKTRPTSRKMDLSAEST